MNIEPKQKKRIIIELIALVTCLLLFALAYFFRGPLKWKAVVFLAPHYGQTQGVYKVGKTYELSNADKTLQKYIYLSSKNDIATFYVVQSDGSLQEQEYATNSLIVIVKKGVTRAQLEELNKKYQTSITFAYEYALPGGYGLQAPDNINIIDLVSAYNNEPIIERADLNGIGHVTSGDI